MPIQLDNRISYVDIFVIAGVVMAGVVFVASYGVEINANTAGIKSNTTEIRHVADDVTRIEADGQSRDEKILQTLEKNREEYKEEAVKSEEARIRIEDKLDKLIERELDGK